MQLSLDHPNFIAARPVAQAAGTEQILLGLQGSLLEFAQRIGCDVLGSSGNIPRGLPFRLHGRQDDLFSFWVERLADKKPGLAAIQFPPESLVEELRPEFSKLIAQLQGEMGYAPVVNGMYKVSVGFTTVEDGLVVLSAIDKFVGTAMAKMAKLGASAFAPHDPVLRAGRGRSSLKGKSPEVAGWTKDEAPPGVDEKVWAQILRRRGQRKFREALLKAYGKRCAITGCSVEAALEAAHITPYSEDAVYGVGDGLPLRADIHTLFDLHLIAVDPVTLKVRVAPPLAADYGEWDGRPLALPAKEEDRPMVKRLAEHHDVWLKLAGKTGSPISHPRQ